MKKLNIVFLLLLITNLSFAQNLEIGTGVRAVKVGLGKNPSGKIIANYVLDEKGVVEIKITENGNYFVKLTQPSTNQAKSKGNGVKSVKVGLGKNPPGDCCGANLSCCAKGVTNKNGDVEFKNLEEGNYQLVLLENDNETLNPIRTTLEMKKKE